MDVLLHITNPDAVHIATPLARAFTNRGTAWGCFLTNDGVKVLGDAEFMAAISGAERTAVCEHSWDLHMNGQACPVEKGSQTINSTLMANAAKVVSL
jgi:hypothetical protein